MDADRAFEAERVVRVANDADVVAAREAARALAVEVGFRGTDLVLIATAISELARNILVYARTGEVRLSVVTSAHRRGVRVVAADEGPGIADIELAMQDGYTSGRGLGVGLPGARRLMDDFEIDSGPGRGTRVTVVKWLGRNA
ncbi:MAG TPA: anti-sigma regulatory factor [Candidatus Dormibacteraeota bacterium]|jgi:serine/threonine-protein kinase RsbT|nr:anti-sigma regulatory factor [Candidatus Dormibacteraeota bacterium]